MVKCYWLMLKPLVVLSMLSALSSPCWARMPPFPGLFCHRCKQHRNLIPSGGLVVHSNSLEDSAPMSAVDSEPDDVDSGRPLMERRAVYEWPHRHPATGKRQHAYHPVARFVGGPGVGSPLDIDPRPIMYDILPRDNQIENAAPAKGVKAKPLSAGELVALLLAAAQERQAREQEARALVQADQGGQPGGQQMGPIGLRFGFNG